MPRELGKGVTSNGPLKGVVPSGANPGARLETFGPATTGAALTGAKGSANTSTTKSVAGTKGGAATHRAVSGTRVKR